MVRECTVRLQEVTSGCIRTKFIQYFFNKKTTGTISGIYNNFQIFQWRIIIICVYTITDLHAKICTV